MVCCTHARMVSLADVADRTTVVLVTLLPEAAALVLPGAAGVKGCDLATIVLVGIEACLVSRDGVLGLECWRIHL